MPVLLQIHVGKGQESRNNQRPVNDPQNTEKAHPAEDGEKNEQSMHLHFTAYEFRLGKILDRIGEQHVEHHSTDRRTGRPR